MLSKGQSATGSFRFTFEYDVSVVSSQERLDFIKRYRRHLRATRIHPAAETNIKLGLSKRFPLRCTRRKPLKTIPEKVISLPEVSIPGIKNILDPSYSLVGKFIWVAAIITCIVLCFFQIEHRVLLYLSCPVSLTLNARLLSSMSFPGVTICPFYPFWYNKKIVDLKKEYSEKHKTIDVPFWKLLDLPHIDAMKLWNMTRIPDSEYEINRLCEFHKQNCENLVDVKDIYTYIGTCKTFVLKPKIEYDGAYNGLEIFLFGHENYDKTSWLYTILLHEKNELPEHDVFNDVGQYLETNYESNIMVVLRQFEHENFERNPCQGRAEHIACRKRCIEEQMIKGERCRLPYVSHLKELPLCNDSASAERFYRHTEMVYRNMHRSCSHCVRMCKQTMYTLVQNIIMPKNKTWIKILLTENIMQTAKEHESYKLQSLISDIGGNLGLFLGFCLLTILQLLDVIVQKIKCLFKRKNDSK